MSTAYLSIGSNLERERSISACMKMVLDDPVSTNVKFSSVYANPAMGPAGQPEFWNLAAALQTHATPEALFQRARAWESALGRERSHDKYAPRTIDIDLILFGDQHVTGPEFELPHPQLMGAAYMLVPLLEIAPSLLHPISGIPLADALEFSGCPLHTFRKVRLPSC